MKIEKAKFLETELGKELINCIISWDIAISEYRSLAWNTEEYKRATRALDWCQAQWEVYQMVLKQLYGKTYHFTRKNKCYGIATQDQTDWFVKFNRLVCKIQQVRRK